MIKIAFCDDDMEVLHQMNELLDRYRVERNEDITYAAFQSPFELLTEIEKGIRPDILFLDVVMPGQNGMDVAKEIRQYDTNMKIIFLTSSPEFAVESYSVGAYFYQLKPIWEESFFRLMDAVLSGACTKAVIADCALLVTAGTVGRLVLLGTSGVLSHKGAYGALFRVRCMVTEHLAKVSLGALDERSTGAVKTVLNEDIEKLELFLAHNLPEFVAYLTGPVVIFLYLLSVNAPLALVSLIPLPLAGIVMAVIFQRMKGVLSDVNRSLVGFNSVMIEYISGMRLIKAYNMGRLAAPSRSFPMPLRRRTGSGTWSHTRRLRPMPPFCCWWSAEWC